MATSKTTRVRVPEISTMARSIFERARDIKRLQPGISREIDRLELQIRGALGEIRGQIRKLDPHDRDLVTVLVINGIHRTAEEVLVDRAPA